MKMQIVRDTKGIVVSTAELPQRDEAVVEFELEDGQTLEEIEAPRKYQFDLKDFYKQCRKITSILCQTRSWRWSPIVGRRGSRLKLDFKQVSEVTLRVENTGSKKPGRSRAFFAVGVDF